MTNRQWIEHRIRMLSDVHFIEMAMIYTEYEHYCNWVQPKGNTFKDEHGQNIAGVEWLKLECTIDDKKYDQDNI